MDTANSIGYDTTNVKKLSDEELEKLWLSYFKDKTNKQLRDALIVQYIYLIRYVVGRLRTNLPASIATDDIAGYGVEGLINAVERFSPDKGAKFETYALMRIRGSIIDTIRSQDWIPRSTRKKFKEIKEAISKLQETLGRTPRTHEIAEAVELPEEKVTKLMSEMDSHSVISLYDKQGSSSEAQEVIDTVQDSNSKDPLAVMEEKDVKSELSRALSRLPERERMILALYYHENMTLKEIGEAISVSESRVCQLHAQAIMKLRNILTTDRSRLRKSIIS